MSKQTNSVDSGRLLLMQRVPAKSIQTGKPTKLTGALLRIRPDAPLLPANVAAEILMLELESDPSMIHEMIDAGLFPNSCREVVRPIDVYHMRQKWAARIGVSQRATLRSRDVKIVN